MINGGCHCGAYRYQVALECLDDVAHCHCSSCRRTTGGTLVTWATVPAERFTWHGGTPTSYNATPHARRYLCERCGTQLAMDHDDYPGTVDITVTSLDYPEQVVPDRHIWFADRLSWLHVDEQLPNFNDENWPPMR